MLKKLLKYDIRYISKVFLLTIVGLFAAGALTGGCLGGMIRVFESSTAADGSTQAVFLMLTGMLLYFLTIIGFVLVAALPTICVFVLYYRFYRNLYTDQGYLSFTLPLKPTTHLHSKLIVSTATTVILDIFVLLAYVLAGCVALLICSDMIRENIDNLQYIKELISDWMGSNGDAIVQIVLYILITLFSTLITRLANICLVFFDITFACSIVKKHKLLASIGMFLIVNGVVGSIVYVVDMAFAFFGAFALSGLWGPILTMAVMILLYTVIGVVSYILNRHYINKKLNLQ